MVHSLRGTVSGFMEVVGRTVGSTGISPNVLTLLGLAINLLAAVVVYTGSFTIGGVVFLVASAFDMLDGAVARATGTATRFGAFFDSVMDRYAEAGVLVALIALAAGSEQSSLAFSAALALVGSFLVSYTRARAEGIGVDCEVGFLQRPERVIVLATGLIFPDLLLAPAIWLIAAVANFTAVQRIWHVWRILGEPGDGRSTPRL